MRHDCRIDKQQVRCPNASTLAYGQWKARVGDWITYQVPDSDRVNVGRMIGRIAYAPPCGETPAIKGWILAIELSEDLDHGRERWINPAHVTQVQRNTPDIGRFLLWFASDDLTTKTPDYWRGFAEYGGMKANHEPSEPTWDLAGCLQRYAEMRARQDKARADQGVY